MSDSKRSSVCLPSWSRIGYRALHFGLWERQIKVTGFEPIAFWEVVEDPTVVYLVVCAGIDSSVRATAIPALRSHNRIFLLAFSILLWERRSLAEWLSHAWLKGGKNYYCLMLRWNVFLSTCKNKWRNILRKLGFIWLKVFIIVESCNGNGILFQLC